MADEEAAVNVDAAYANLVAACVHYGQRVTTRGHECRRTVGPSFDFDSTPLVAARATAWKNALREMEWFLTARSNRIDKLHEKVRHWWSPWVDKSGHVPFNYGYQLRKWNGHFDQVVHLVEGVMEHPFSRRNVITTWNTADMADPACPITNCHGTVVQTFGNVDGSLDLLMYQLSADVVVGLGANWIQYWAVLLWLCRLSGRKPGRFLWRGGDVHVYQKHSDLAEEIVRRAHEAKPTPQLAYTPTSEDFKADDFSLDREYEPVVRDRAEMVV